MPRTRRLGMAMVLALATLIDLSALEARALPRYSARYEQNCLLCHVNPSGAGMRSAYASKELVPKELAWSPATPAMLAEIDPAIGKHIGMGTDFRIIYLAADPAAGLGVQQGFFQMQGDVYLSFQPDPRFTLYYDRGLSNTYEVFGIAQVLPWSGYLKAGRFVPSYGWRFDDHTMYVRSELGFFPPANSDVGLEAGIATKHLDLQLGLINGNRGSTQDTDRRLATALNALYHFRAGPLAAALGLSGYSHPGPTEDVNTGGVCGYLAGWNVTWLGQADLARREPAAGTAVTGLVTSHELSVLLHQGLELKGTYDFFDPDRDHQTGARARWGGGVAVMPRSFLALEGLVRNTHVDPGTAVPGKDFSDGLFQIHFLY